jgi:hypothetical protein
MTCPKYSSWVHETESILAFERLEMNTAQSASVPCVTLCAFIPPNEKKFHSLRFVHICSAHDVNVMYTDDFGKKEVTTVPTIIAIGFEQHNVAVRSLGIDDVLSPSDIVSGVVKSGEVVMINSVALEKNRIVLFDTGRCLHGRFRGFRFEAIKDMFFQSRQEILNDMSE